MVKITTIGTGSSGNCYKVENNGEAILIECGVSWNTILKKLDFKIDDIVGCIVSHRHSDHFSPNTARKIILFGIPIFANDDVINEYPLSDIQEIKEKKHYSIGNFDVLPFEVKHSAKCYGYIITCPDNTRLCFLTDCSNVHYRFKNINIFMVEANYSDSSVIGNIIDGVQKSHFEEHLSLDECIEFIQANESDNIRHILLIHLSDNNSNEKEFLERVGSLFGHEKVSIATNGQLLEIE